MRALLLTLLVALPVAAQVFLPARRIAPAAPTAAPWTPEDIDHIRFYWNHADLTADAPVTNWVERIQGYTVGQATGANRPTNSAASGVWFDGSNFFLTNAPTFNWVASAPTSSVWIVLTASTPLTGNDYILGTDNLSAYGLAAQSGGPNLYYWATSGNQSAGNFLAGTTRDVSIVISNAPTQIYTNAVLAVSANLGTPVGAQKFFGWDQL